MMVNSLLNEKRYYFECFSLKIDNIKKKGYNEYLPEDLDEEVRLYYQFIFKGKYCLYDGISYFY